MVVAGAAFDAFGKSGLRHALASDCAHRRHVHRDARPAGIRLHQQLGVCAGTAGEVEEPSLRRTEVDHRHHAAPDREGAAAHR